MKALKIIGIVLVAIVAVLFVSTLFMPSKSTVERSTEINAPVETVFAQVNDLKNWAKWDPWHKMDTMAEYTFSENSVGVGATQSWKSTNGKVGEGEMKIVESVDNEKIMIDLNFKDQGTAQGYYNFEKTENGTKVTWGMNMDAGSNPIKKLFQFAFAGVIEKQFDDGLKSLKEISEAAPPPAPAATYKMEDIVETTTAEFIYLSIKDSCDTTGQAMKAKFTELYTEISALAAKQSLEAAGAPFAIYHVWNPAGNKVVLEAGIPVNKDGKSEGRVMAGKMKSVKAAMVNYYGVYDNLGKAHEAMNAWITANGKQYAGSPWEVYATDPGKESDPMKVLTQIYYPIQ